MIAEIPDLDEKKAVVRLKQGDLDGMEVLVERYQVRAVYAAYLIARDWNHAEDIVQNAFLNAAEKIAQFDECRPFGPWFMRSVINAAIKTAERQKRLVPLLDEDEDETTSWAYRLLDPGPQPGEIVETQETRQRVWDALGQLAPQQRGVVVMRHFLEMDEAEMTRQLDRPRTTIRWWLRTARKRLREILLPDWQTGYDEVKDGKREDVKP